MRRALPLWMVAIIAFTLIPYSDWKAVEYVAWAAGTVRYVDSTAGTCVGNYSIASRNCTGSDGNSYANITAAITAMAAGDITYARGGTYTDGNLNLPAGVSASVPSILQAYQDELVVVRPASGLRVIYTVSRPYIKYWNLELDGANITSDNVKVDVGSHYFVLGGDLTSGGAFRCKIHNSGQEGLSIQGNVDNGTVSGCDIYDSGLGVTVSPYAHGVYLQRGTGWTFTRNRIRRNGCYGFQANGSTHPVNLLFSRNLVYDNARTSGCGIQAIFNGTGHTVEYSAFWNDLEAGNTEGIRVEADNTTLRHLSLYNAGANTGIRLTANASGSRIQNSVIIGSTTGIVNLGVGSTLTANLTSGTASSIFTSVTTGAIDLSLKVGTTPIDGGTNISLAYNNTFPDQGAHEVPVFSACEVRAAATSAVRVTFANNLRPPMLPASGVTGVTFRKNGASNAVLSSARVGDNQFDFTVTNSYVGGDTVEVSIVPASTNLTDSALIGSTNNQPFVSTLTNTVCTNNAAGASAAVMTQTKFRVHGLYGAEDSPIVKAATNANYSVVLGGAHRLRIKIAGTVADPEPTGFQLRVSHNGGAYAALTDAYVNHVKMYAATHVDIPDGAVTTEQLLSDHITNVAGAVVSYSHAVPNVDLSQDSEAELEYVLQYEDTAVIGDTYDYRLYTNAGDALTAYTVTPRINIKQSQATGGY